MMGQQLPTELVRTLKREKYQLIGHHSAAKKCSWFHKSLTGGMACYKSQFYGIKSWRCLQMTPTIAHCTLRCSFCWRVQSTDLGLSFNETALQAYDEPELIVDEALNAQRRILSGYKAHPRLNKNRYEEAKFPAHAAISLAGEPTLYPKIGKLIGEFRRRGLTTFLVTNGTCPDMLANLEVEPSQLYVSVCASTEEMFARTCRPNILGAWGKLQQTLSLLKSFSCPTVMRLTLARGVNLFDPEGYGKLVTRAEPTYVEPKAYVYVGMSRLRLNYENMPTHGEVSHFADVLSKATGYKMIDESLPSRVVLLSRSNKPKKIA